jgi:hypothetical protein
MQAVVRCSRAACDRLSSGSCSACTAGTGQGLVGMLVLLVVAGWAACGCCASYFGLAALGTARCRSRRRSLVERHLLDGIACTGNDSTNAKAWTIESW